MCTFFSLKCVSEDLQTHSTPTPYAGAEDEPERQIRDGSVLGPVSAEERRSGGRRGRDEVGQRAKVGDIQDGLHHCSGVPSPRGV